MAQKSIMVLFIQKMQLEKQLSKIYTIKKMYKVL